MKSIDRHQSFFNVGRDAVNQSTQINGNGFNYFNFLASGGGVVPVDTGISIEDFRKMSRVLFKSDFDVGLDTLRTWNLVFNDALVADSSDASDAVSGNNQVGPAEVVRNRIPLFVEPSTYAENSTSFILNSKNYPRFNASSSAFFFYQGLFAHDGVTTNTESYSIKYTLDGEDQEFDKAEWNIDTLDGSEGAGNPSGILIDFTKIQTFFIYFAARDVGDVKVGFLINNEFYFVHQIKLNNSEEYLSTPPWGPLNLPVRVDAEKQGANSLVYEYGLFEKDNGIRFVTNMSLVNDPAIIVKKYLHSVFAYSYGGIQNNNLSRPFSIGNGEDLVTVVTATERPILTLRNDSVFNGNVNKASYSLKSVEFYNKSADLQAGCVFRIRYNAALSGFSFNQVDPNSSVDFDIFATTLPSPGVIILEKIVFPNNSSLIEFSDDDLINNVLNEFSYVEIFGRSVSEAVAPWIVMTAHPLTGIASCDVGGTFRWVEKY